MRQLISSLRSVLVNARSFQLPKQINSQDIIRHYIATHKQGDKGGDGGQLNHTDNSVGETS